MPKETTTAFIGVDPDVRNLNFACVVEENGVPHLEWVYNSFVSEKDTTKAIIAQSAHLNGSGFEGELYGLIMNSKASKFYGAVEGQNAAYAARSGVPPQALIYIATIGGICLSKLAGVLSTGAEDGQDELLLPLPSQWKGNAPKHICQARACEALGMDFELKGGKKNMYCVPKLPHGTRIISSRQSGKMPFGAWADAMDSVALAVWLWKEHDKQKKMNKWRNKK